MATTDIVRDLEDVRRDIDRINAGYIDKACPSFEKLPPEVRLNERFEMLFVAEYPDGFDRRAIELLRQISRNGPPAGKYLFIHWHQDVAGPREVKLDDFEKPYFVPWNGASPVEPYELTVSSGPDATLEREILEKLVAARPPERRLGWEDLVQPRDGRIWAESPDQRIETPVGGAGVSQLLRVWFGVDDDGRPCAHGMLGAMPGAGKSNLYHVLILGLAVRYSPKDLRMYLIDGKFGVEFQDYRDLPHADVVSLHTPPEVSRSVLESLLDEMERRNALFARAGVVDLTGYRRAGQPSGPVPRVLLLVDEYQELFEGDRDGVASKQLLQLAQQGRSAGIHMLLGAQKFGVVGLMHQAAVMGSIHLRIAMQLPHDAVQALAEFGRDGRRLIAACDLPGKAVINDQSGDDSRNHAGKVAFLTADKRREWLARLKQKAQQELSEQDRGRGIVCDGQAQPLLIENPFVQAELRRRLPYTPKERETVARTPHHGGGLATDDWYTGERPFAMWLGQEFNVNGHARLILRRRPGEAAVIVGGSHAARYGMFASMLFSVALASDPGSVRVVLVDRSIPDTPWHGTLDEAARTLTAHGFAVSYDRGGPQADRLIFEIADEVARRRAMTEEHLLHEPSVFVFIADADRVRSLERQPGRLGLEETELGRKLQTILLEGPSAGVHPILGFSGFMPMTRALDPRRLEQFRHRIALQVSEDDSFSLVRTRKAAQLQAHGQTPIAALYCDIIGGKENRFKPYAVDERTDWTGHWNTLSARIHQWRQARGNG
jgi:S-DNA-T family DNA segregation ATPase FtsK/SpoIIIE